MRPEFNRLFIALLLGAIIACATTANKATVASQCPFGQYSLDEIQLKATIIGENRRAVFVSTDGATIELREGETIGRECATIAPIDQLDRVILLLKNGEKRKFSLPVVSYDADGNRIE